MESFESVVVISREKISGVHRTKGDRRCANQHLLLSYLALCHCLLGVVTSVLSSFLGMKIATYANVRTTLEARKGVGKAFIVAFFSGAVMSFLLAANGLLFLYIAIKYIQDILRG